MSDKYDAIKNAPTPQKLQELRSFLGLLNYYRKFLPNITSILHPPNELLCADQTWCWTQECAQVFQEAKDLLTTSYTTTQNYCLNLWLSLQHNGIGAAVSHIFLNGEEKLLCLVH